MKKIIIGVFVIGLMLVCFLLPVKNKEESVKEELLGISYDVDSNLVELTNYDTENPVVAMYVKNYGSIVIELYPEIAPNTVSNFISLIKEGL